MGEWCLFTTESIGWVYIDGDIEVPSRENFFLYDHGKSRIYRYSTINGLTRRREIDATMSVLQAQPRHG